MRIAMFVDGNNLFYTMKSLGWRIDYRKMLSFASNGGQVVDAYYFASYSDNDNQGQFINTLSYMGYSCVIKPTVKDKDGNDVKANMDLEMGSAVLLSMHLFDKAILVTGDGDFECIVKILRDNGKDCDVLSASVSMSRQFRNMLGLHYTDIGEHRDMFELVFESD